MRIRDLILAPVLITLGACAATKSNQDIELLGATWELTGELVVRPRKSMVFIQEGEIKHTKREGDKFEAYCNVQLKVPVSSLYKITGGSFVVKRVTYASDSISLNVVRYATSMAVSSAAHPEVARITCQHWSDNSDHYMSTEQMRQTMQGLFLLHSPPAAASGGG